MSNPAIDDATRSGVGGPGGSAPTIPRSTSAIGSRPSGGSLSNGAPRAPSQADRPVRKGSKSGGDMGSGNTPLLPPQTPPSRPASVPRPSENFTSQPYQAPAPPSAMMPVAAPLPQVGYQPRPLMQNPATPAPPTPYARMLPAAGPTHLQRYQTNLANTITSPALAALQGEHDPLLEVLDPFLGKSAGGSARTLPPPPPPPPVTHHITHNDLAYLGSDELQQLVDSYGSHVSGGFPSMQPERVDISPPGTPALGRKGRRRDPAAVVAELEDREMTRAARELLEEKLEGLDVRRKALENYYNTNQDIGQMDGHIYGSDPVRMAHLQRAARVDPFVQNLGLGVPVGVDHTRLPVGSVHRGHLENGREYLGNNITTVRDIADDGWDAALDDEGPVVRVAPSPLHGASKSLVVGVGYCGTQHEVPEAGKNVDRIKAYLMENGFFGQQLTLRDDPATPPDSLSTHANLLTAAKWLTEGARPGQCLFFYFCGRAQPSNEDPTGTDLLPSDFEQAGAIPESVLTSILTSLPPGVKLTLLIDCFPSGSAVSLPFKMHPTADGSFRVTEGQTAPSSAVIVQISAMRATPLEGPEPPSNLTQSFVTATARSKKPTYRSLMLTLRRGLAVDSYVACVSLNRPVDFKKAVFHLGAPESSGEDDPRLCEAKERTRSLARELGLAEEEAMVAAEEKNLETMKRAEEERKIADEKRKKLEETMKEMKRLMALETVEKAMNITEVKESAGRARVKDEEATLRHNLVRLKHDHFRRTLENAIQGTGWSRIPAGENTGLPIVVGVKWQKPTERQSTRQTSIQRALTPPTGKSIRQFAVVPPHVRNVDEHHHNPQHIYPQHQHLMGGGGGGMVALPVTPTHTPHQRPAYPENKTIKWTRTQPNTNQTPQWVREEVTDEAGTPAATHHHPVLTAPYP